MEQLTIFSNRIQYPIPRLPKKYLTEEGWWDDWFKTWRKRGDPFAWVGIPSKYMQVDKTLNARYEYTFEKE